MNTFIVSSALFIAFIWAGIAIVTKLALTKIHVITLFSVTVATTIIVAIFTIPYYSNVILQDFRNHSKVVMISMVAMFIGIIISQFLYYYVIKQTSHTSYTIALMYTTPLFALVIGMFILKDEHISLSGVIGILLIFIGSVIMSLNIKSKK